MLWHCTEPRRKTFLPRPVACQPHTVAKSSVRRASLNIRHVQASQRTKVLGMHAACEGALHSPLSIDRADRFARQSPDCLGGWQCLSDLRKRISPASSLNHCRIFAFSESQHTVLRVAKLPYMWSQLRQNVEPYSQKNAFRSRSSYVMEAGCGCIS